jgi:hypoxanthine phosphoribosyltransferase
MFASDLARAIQRPMHMDFLTPTSPGFGPATEVQLLYDPEMTIRGKHVLLLEDVIETGSTVSRLMASLGARSPRSLEVCALVRKRSVTGTSWPVRFVGFEAPSEFLVGYGLDHADRFRHLPYIVSLE